MARGDAGCGTASTMVRGSALWVAATVSRRPVTGRPAALRVAQPLRSPRRSRAATRRRRGRRAVLAARSHAVTLPTISLTLPRSIRSLAVVRLLRW
jgi:hypothetical protein